MNEMRAVYPRNENKNRNAEEHLTWDDIENEKCNKTNNILEGSLISRLDHAETKKSGVEGR